MFSIFTQFIENRGKEKTIAAIAAIICFLVFFRAIFCGFINLDDPSYIIDNLAIRVLDNQFFKEAFTTSYMGWWMPLTWISLALDYYFWGLNPLGYHLTNNVLHAFNTGLVVLIADRVLKDRWHRECGNSQLAYNAMLLFTGLLFGIHPLRVESVVWVTERKDVLNGVFTLGAILCYLSHVQLKESGRLQKAKLNYYFSLVLFTLSLMAKPVSVVLPAMFLVADWFPLGRMQKGNIIAVLQEKLPFVFVSITIAFATIHSASGGSILMPLANLSFQKRIVLSGYALYEYVCMSIYPVGIIHLYLLPNVFPVSYYIEAAISLIATMFFILFARKKPHYLATGLLFVLPLVPVLGFLQNGSQSHAARFTYLPSVASSIAISAAVYIGCKRVMTMRLWRANFIPAVLFALLFAIMTTMTSITVGYIGDWKDSGKLWTRAIEIKPIGRYYLYRAEFMMRTGRFVECAENLAVSIHMALDSGYPGIFNLYALRGDALNKAGMYEDAIIDFSEAIRLRDHPEYYYNRGLALEALGKLAAAEIDYQLAGSDAGPIDWKALY